MTNNNKNIQQGQQEVKAKANPLAGEKIGADLLLRGWNMALQTVNEAVEFNKRSGVKYPERFTSAFFDYMEPMDIRKKSNWLKACINVKTNTPYTLDTLENAQVISPEERPLFGDLPLPRRELVRLVRMQLPTDKSEWLVRGEMWYGLNRSAGIVTTTVYDLDYTRHIQVRREYVDKDPANQGGEQVFVKIVGDSNQWLTAERIYLTPFNKETVQQAMINAGPPTQKSLLGRIELILNREGAPNPKGLTPENNNIDTFVNKNFDELFDVKPTPTNVTNMNIDPETFRAFLKYQQEHKQDHQYQ